MKMYDLLPRGAILLPDCHARGGKRPFAGHRNGAGGSEQCSPYRIVKLKDVFDVESGDYDHMASLTRLRQVHESHREAVLMHHARWFATGRNLAEDTNLSVSHFFVGRSAASR